MALRLRRGLDSDRQTITPKQGELLYVTDTGAIWVGDGTTVGGNQIGLLQTDTTPQLSGNLDLNSNDIVGTGNINIDGTITATGNINLGDAPADNINVGGNFSSNLLPATDSAYNLGSPTQRWNNIWATGATIDGHVEVGSIQGNIIDSTSTIAFNPTTSTFTGNFVGDTTGYHTGDVSGSLFAIDSSTLVDAINGVFRGTEIRTLSVTNEGTGPITITVPSDQLNIDATKIQNTRTDNSVDISVQRVTAGTVGATENIGRHLYNVNEAGIVTNAFSHVVTKNAMVFFPTPGGAEDFTKYMLLWNNGKVRICGDDVADIQAEPDAQLDVSGIMRLSPQSAAPGTEVEGQIAIADRVNWDPASKGSGASYPVYYDGTTWNAFY